LPSLVVERTISAPTLSEHGRVTEVRARRLPGGSLVQNPWVIVSVVVIVVSALFVVGSGVRPEFDTYGWLVWRRQALHWNLDTNAAPSWKPLTFLFTFAYSLAGDGELWLWMVTAVAGALAGAIFAGRIAYRITGPAPGREYARIVAAVFAGLGVLGIAGYWHLVLIAASDPMDITLCLAAIDYHLSGRPRTAWVLLVLISLARPEAWTVTALYAAWAWRAAPSMRTRIMLGIAVIPALWFVVTAARSDRCRSIGRGRGRFCLGRSAEAPTPNTATAGIPDGEAMIGPNRAPQVLAPERQQPRRSARPRLPVRPGDAALWRRRPRLPSTVSQGLLSSKHKSNSLGGIARSAAFGQMQPRERRGPCARRGHPDRPARRQGHRTGAICDRRVAEAVVGSHEGGRRKHSRDPPACLAAVRGRLDDAGISARRKTQLLSPDPGRTKRRSGVRKCLSSPSRLLNLE
jgi:hypothetical protein